jgi:3-phenylpropionate/trans-cinnamate dioxygenase ferredoxin reductase subunit
VVAPVVSEFFRETHASNGVEIRLNSGCARVHGGAHVEEVELSGGARLPADLVIVGIGVVPNSELARDAGLAVGNGVAVDDRLSVMSPSGSSLDSSSLRGPRIFAIGDCAEFPSRFTGTRVRLESVQNCVDQAICVGRAIAGRPAAYSAVPWFWSDQYDVRLQMAGLPQGFDQTVMRGEPAAGKFSVFYFSANRLLAVDSINRPADHLAARKLIGSGAAINPAQAADQGFDLKALSQSPL